MPHDAVDHTYMDASLTSSTRQQLTTISLQTPKSPICIQKNVKYLHVPLCFRGLTFNYGQKSFLVEHNDVTVKLPFDSLDITCHHLSVSFFWIFARVPP